jgi:hypothetical protein
MYQQFLQVLGLLLVPMDNMLAAVAVIAVGLAALVVEVMDGQCHRQH